MLKNLIDALRRIAHPNQICDYKVVASCALIGTGAEHLKIGSGEGIEFGFIPVGNDKPEFGSQQIVLSLQGRVLCGQFQDMLHRALNTWEPEKRPEWAMDILDKLTGMPKQMVRPTPAVQGFERGDANDPSAD